MNNLQEKKEVIGEINRQRLTDIICILTISKIKLVELVAERTYITVIRPLNRHEIVLPFDEFSYIHYWLDCQDNER